MDPRSFRKEEGRIKMRTLFLLPRRNNSHPSIPQDLNLSLFRPLTQIAFQERTDFLFQSCIRHLIPKKLIDLSKLFANLIPDWAGLEWTTNKLRGRERLSLFDQLLAQSLREGDKGNLDTQVSITGKKYVICPEQTGKTDLFKMLVN